MAFITYDDFSSSVISKVQYDGKKSVLRITFKKENTAYDYMDVPEAHFINFQNAKSIGQYYTFNIKDKYRMLKV